MSLSRKISGEGKSRASIGHSNACMYGLGAARVHYQTAKLKMLSGHFQNSLEDDCKPVFTDANTKEATENKVNGYGRSVCDREK